MYSLPLLFYSSFDSSLYIVRTNSQMLKGEFLNIVCTEAGSMFVLCLEEPVWIMDQITKTIIHFLRLLVASSKCKILGDFRLLKSFANFMKQKFHDSGGFMAFLSWSILEFGGWSFMCTRVRSPFRGGFNFIYNFYYIDSVFI